MCTINGMTFRCDTCIYQHLKLHNIMSSDVRDYYSPLLLIERCKVVGTVAEDYITEVIKNPQNGIVKKTRLVSLL